jgi:hypothetical protein
MIWALLAASVGFVGTQIVWWLRVRALQQELDRTGRWKQLPPPRRPNDSLIATQPYVPAEPRPPRFHKELFEDVN